MQKTLKEHVKEYGRRPRRSLGQVFLIERTVQEKILDISDLQPEDVVVEIGPGTGTLTRDIASRVRTLIALEVDKALAFYLRDSWQAPRNVYLICMDALRFDYRRPAERLGRPVKIVGNIPYVISAPLLFTLGAYKDWLSLATLMVQKEVAERLTARPGTKPYGALTVLCHRNFETRIMRRVSRYCFSPVPKVDSAIIQCTPRQSDFKDPEVELAFVRLVKSLFSKRRKTIFNALRFSRPFDLADTLLAEALRLARIEASRRPETLAYEEFFELARFLGGMSEDRRL